MNDSELEDQLRALSPRSPSPELEERVARELSASPAQTAPFARAGVISRQPRGGSAWRWLRDIGWACAGATLALIAGAFFAPEDTVAPVPESTSKLTAVASDAAFDLAGTTSELVATEDSDQVVETENGPVREVRYSFRERHAWTNPRTGARMEIELPRQDVYLVPVSLQ
jgi:hypothetical protein